MKELMVIKPKIPEIPKKWNYDKSVKKMKPLIYKWKNLTIEMLKELYIAREKLRSPGRRTDLDEEE